MEKTEVYRARCSFGVSGSGLAAEEDAKSLQGDTKSVPTSPNLLRSSNINALSLNNKVNQNIQFFTKLSTIEDGANRMTAPGSPRAATQRKKDKSPARLADKENDQLTREKADGGDDRDQSEGDKDNKGKEKDADEKSPKPERVKVLLDLPRKEQISKSSEDLTEVADDVNEKDIKDLKDLSEIFLNFKEGDLFRVLSKEWDLWWAVRSLDANRRVGLVQAQLLEKTEDELLDDGDTDMDQIESTVKASLDELRKRIGENDPAGIYSDAMIPEPELMERCNQRNQPVGHGLGGLGRPLPTGGPPLVNSEGLIMPRKPQNPCLDSTEKQNLHRELLFNQKIGKSVLGQKSELQIALQKHKEHQVKKEVELQRQQNKTALQRVMEERARKLESKEKTTEKNNGSSEPEFMKVRAKLQAKMETK